MRAIRLPICGASLALAVMIAPAAMAQTRDDEGGVRGAARTAGDVAMTPLSDLNLRKDEIPEALQDAAIAPYASEKLVNCAAIVTEIDRLTAVLGPDVELIDADDGLNVGDVAKSVVGGLIPFRGIVRQLSGAAKREKQFQAAIYAGAVRRGFLKGLGQERQCDYPARPADMAEREAFAAEE